MPIGDEAAQRRLLQALAEELKLPLIQIARQSELMRAQSATASDTIQHTAEMALGLIDGYLLSLTNNELPQLQFEPITISSVFYDVAHELEPLAKRQGYELQVNLKNKYAPVMSERGSIDAAFRLLGYGMMSSAPAAANSVITLGAHKSAKGIVAGIFTDNSAISADAFRRAKVLSGSARQTFPNASYGSGAGILIAESLMNYLSAPLKVARHQRNVGLAATFQQSRQMQLV